jgi:VWFA-related protein
VIRAFTTKITKITKAGWVGKVLPKALFVCFVFFVVKAVGTAQQLPTFRASTDAVTVDVSVRDRTRVVTNLTAADFEVFDNDVLQQVTDVSYGKLPIDVTVALDVSLSVTGPLLERLRTAVRQLMRDLGGDDRLKLITFNMRISRIVDFTTDASAVDQAIQTANAGGGSSIWDAIGVALVSAAEPNRRQLVVVFTDGADGTSTMTPEALVELSRRTNASVTSVVAGGSGVLVRALTPGASVLQKLGTETGGTVIPVAGPSQDLTATFRRALEEFRSSYVLHYTPSNVERGGYHTLRVSVKRGPAFTVRARRGYFWG